MFHAIFRTSHWDEPLRAPKGQPPPAGVHAPEHVDRQAIELDPEAQRLTGAEPRALPEDKPKPTEKAVAAPLLGVMAGFGLLHVAPPVGLAVIITSSAWLFYKSI